MKTKLLIVLAISCLGYTGFGQSKTTFGIRGGVNFYNINGKDLMGEKLGNSLKTGFNIGTNIEIPVGIDFYVQPGLLFSTKGAKDVFNTQDKIHLSYFEIPINFLYKPELGTGHLLLGFGPYAAFAAGGSYKFANGNDADIRFKSTVTPTEVISGTYYMKRFDAGANLLFGYQFANRFSIQLDAGLGLVNINSSIEGNSSDKSAYKNTGFGISAGYRF